MATATLRILIDGFRKGEMVHVAAGSVLSGTVEAVPVDAVHCKHFWLRAGWHTEGKGNRNEEQIVRNDLFQGDARGGERLALPFSVPVPLMPWSYAGHYINIVWAISVEMDVPWSRNPKTELIFVTTAPSVALADAAPFDPLPDDFGQHLPTAWLLSGNTVAIQQMPNISLFGPQFDMFSSDVISVIQGFQPNLDADTIVQQLKTGSGDLMTGVPERDVDLLRRRLEATGLRIVIR